jgi:hypothetical protein
MPKAQNFIHGGPWRDPREACRIPGGDARFSLTTSRKADMHGHPMWEAAMRMPTCPFHVECEFHNSQMKTPSDELLAKCFCQMRYESCEIAKRMPSGARRHLLDLGAACGIVGLSPVLIELLPPKTPLCLAVVLCQCHFSVSVREHGAARAQY